MTPAPKKGPKAKASNIWEQEPDAMKYREEVVDYAGLKFKITRRSLTFPEETRLLAKCMDKESKRVDWLEFLAGVVNLTVKENDFQLTPKRVREDLPQRPGLAWMLIKWLCRDTMANIEPNAMEDLRKKPGP